MSGLQHLLEQATKRPWSAWEDEFGWHVSGPSEDVTGALAHDQAVDARLIALAPEMARLLVDIVADDGTMLRPSLLTRFLELDARAGGQP